MEKRRKKSGLLSDWRTIWQLKEIQRSTGGLEGDTRAPSPTAEASYEDKCVFNRAARKKTHIFCWVCSLNSDILLYCKIVQIIVSYCRREEVGFICKINNRLSVVSHNMAAIHMVLSHILSLYKPVIHRTYSIWTWQCMESKHAFSLNRNWSHSEKIDCIYCIWK